MKFVGKSIPDLRRQTPSPFDAVKVDDIKGCCMELSISLARIKDDRFHSKASWSLKIDDISPRHSKTSTKREIMWSENCSSSNCFVFSKENRYIFLICILCLLHKCRNRMERRLFVKDYGIKSIMSVLRPYILDIRFDVENIYMILWYLTRWTYHVLHSHSNRPNQRLCVMANNDHLRLASTTHKHTFDFNVCGYANNSRYSDPHSRISTFSRSGQQQRYY